MKFRLNKRQLERVSEILGNLGLLFLASFVLPVFTNSEPVELGTMFSGLILSAGCLVESIAILKVNVLR